MKVKKSKALAIVASVGLSAGALSACSSPNSQMVNNDNYKNYKCDRKAVKDDKVQCTDTTRSGAAPIFIPMSYMNSSGGIKPGFVKSSANAVGSKGIGSSKAPANS